ncbi:Glycosyltransferase involved in cell wall bisynthesis [Arenibacter nanhaiticus]|uniref:Glycosyltransferase involved in cell wall bisynthesis n=1 Tax=Arenibacter nanhaiticus TaxID=558155 RepID=A0A1M6KLM0_9FLAO|nr:glycosyltransferase family 4 protein [Arenibacter nanhaiticus]SHJ59794.1 Glycosyltransferase involved in cell wall bisynthesis [Arenibacter nanhaiticus]
MKKKLIRITTVPASLGGLLTGQLKYVSGNYEVVGIASYENGLLDKMGKQEGIRVIPVEMTRTISPLKDLKATWQIYKILKKEKPFMVHTHTPKAGTLGMFAAFLARVPHRMHTIAGMPLLEARGSKRLLLDYVEKITYSCATMIYPNSFGLKEIIIQNKYTTPNKIKVIGNGSSNGIDTSQFDPKTVNESEKEKLRKKLGIGLNDIVYVFVGRMVTDKGVNELVYAFSKLNTSYQNTKLILVGPYEKELDPLWKDTEQMISSNPNIIGVGYQTDVRPFFAISDALTFPSYREGFPNVVMQAGAMGIPSIVSDINGCNEIIKEGLNGFIVPAKNIEKLADAMELLYNRKKENILFDEKQIREMIAKKYDRQTIWEEVLKEYNSLR